MSSRNVSAAESGLKELAEWIIRDRRKMRLVGTTSSGGSIAMQEALSLARARAVAKVLVSLGVPSESITAFGVGKDFPSYVQDVYGNGSLLPGSAAAKQIRHGGTLGMQLSE